MQLSFFFEKILIDGPTTGVRRHSINLKRVSLTNFSIKIPHSCGTATVVKALNASDVISKWKESAWSKKLELRKTRENLTDFDRFKLMILRKRVCFLYFFFLFINLNFFFKKIFK